MLDEINRLDGLGAAALSVFSAVLVRLNLDFPHGFFVGSNQGRTTPGKTVDLDAVHLKAVAVVAGSVGDYAGLIFRHEDAAGGAGRCWPGISCKKP